MDSRNIGGWSRARFPHLPARAPRPIYMAARFSSLRTAFAYALAAVVVLLSACSVREIATSESLAVTSSVAFSPDAKSIAAARNILNIVFIYDASTLKRTSVLLGKDEGYGSQSYFARALAYSRDGTLLATSGIDDTFILWNVATGRESLRIAQLKGALDVAFSPASDLLATAGPGKDAILWDVGNGKARAILKGHTAAVTAIAFSADGKFLATGSADKTVRLWTVEGCQQVAILEGHAYPVHSLSFSRDAALLAAYAGDLKVWELASGQALAPILAEVDTSTVQGLAMLVGILNAATSIQMTGAPGVGPPPPGRFNPDTRAAEGRYPAIFSPDGKHLAVIRFNPGLSGDHEIVLLDVKSKAIVATIQCQCFGLAFSPDGARIATAGHSAHGGPVQLWDVNTGNEIRPSH